MNPATSKKIWDILIIPYFNKCQEKYGGLLCPASGYDELYSHYEDLTRFAKSHYMAEQVVRLNRHKVSAAMMIAILKTKPIKKVDTQFYETGENGIPRTWPFNESLAITVGLSILRSFILERVEKAFSGEPVERKIFDGVCRQDSVIFANGIPLTKKERKEWEWELYQVRQEGAYNLLALAHILSDLETMARLRYFHDHPGESPIFPVYLDNSDNREEESASIDDALCNLKPVPPHRLRFGRRTIN